MKNCGHSMKWKEPAVNLMWWVMIRRRANTFFTIVQRKALKAAEVFVTTGKRWSQGKRTSQEIMRLTWLMPWALNFYRKSNIASYRNSEISIRKRRAG